jgi:hypothetical protein
MPGPEADRTGATQHLAAGQPWRLRAARGPGARAALEIYEGQALLDVMVDTPVAARLLRGARRLDGRRAGGARAIAWGRLPTGEDAAGAAASGSGVSGPGGGLAVWFVRGRLHRRRQRAGLVWLTAWGWIAVADGHYRHAVVTCHGRRERTGLRRARPC